LEPERARSEVLVTTSEMVEVVESNKKFVELVIEEDTRVTDKREAAPTTCIITPAQDTAEALIENKPDDTAPT
jgi:hypothetical protein